MRKLFSVNVIIAFTLVFSLLSPALSLAEKVEESVGILLDSAEVTEDGVNLVWKTVDADTETTEVERFNVLANGVVEEVAPVLVEQAKKENVVFSTYKYVSPAVQEFTVYQVVWNKGEQTLLSNELTINEVEEMNEEVPNKEQVETEKEKENENEPIKPDLDNEATTLTTVVNELVSDVQDEEFKASLLQLLEDDFNEEEEVFLLDTGFVNENSFQLYWFAYVPDKRISTYDLYLNNEFVKTYKARDYEHTFTNLTADTSYEVTVKAYDRNKNLLIEESLTVATFPDPTGEVVTFADVNLQNAIKAQLGVTRELRESDLDKINQLVAYDASIENLEGIERLVNLRFLLLSENNISSVAPLSALTNLEVLILDDNKIVDVSPLKTLTNLNVLVLSYNPVLDISQLGTLTNLEVLLINDTMISDIAVIEQFIHLSYLMLEGSAVDYSEGTEAYALLLRLQEAGVYIDVLDEYLEDDFEVWVDAITENSARILWWYYDEQGKDVTFHVQLNWQNYAVTKDGQLELRGLTPNTTYELYIEVMDENGEVIDFGYVMFETLSEPSGEIVTITDNQLRDVIKEILFLERDIYVSDMERLYWLDAEYRGIKSLEGLQYAKNLYSLYAMGNEITDLSPLANLEELMFVNLSENLITNIDALNGLYIFELDLSFNPISDISVLNTLEDLSYLFLHNTNITDISVLLDLEYLEFVTLFNIPGLTFEEGTPEFEVLQLLLAKGVTVITSEDDYHFYSDIEFDLLYVSDEEIELEWYYYGEENIAGYYVLLDGEWVDDVEYGYYYFEDLSPDTLYTIEVLAYDEEGRIVDSNYMEVFTDSNGDYDEEEELPETDIEDEDEVVTPVKEKKEEKVNKEDKKVEAENKLPNTATNTMNFILFGIILLLVGGLGLFTSSRKRLA
ncbi:leucine-rich repeat domain-containing protein [Bacillus sp. FJAT-45066]|uniref:leucine-rich repeat domain-containing protein n=1 Tax=Bacillus sp. FJAT-45066 TaxID=2011010 RepID=UPI000BB76533|nr:leucine-rich repeat domain-containing protein [Bacillus sp. FJAT-45066]